VYTYPKERRHTYAHLLASVVQEEEFHAWTQEEVDEVYNETNGDVRSNLLQIYTKHGVGYKASNDPLVRSGTRPVQTTVQPTRQPASPPLVQIPQQPQQPLPPIQPPVELSTQRTYSKEISEVAKMITEEQKYSGNGEDESLDHKLTIFYDICARVNLPQELYVRAFPALLKGLAQDHFYNNQLSQRNLDDIYTNLKNFFEGPGYHRRNLDKWNTITLSTVTAEAKNSTKSTQECLQLLINKLRKLQYSLTPKLENY
jgi:hypothetical protein